MILGQTPGPTASSPINFDPPAVGGGNVFKLPKTGWLSKQLQPLAQVMNPPYAYPAYSPAPRGGPVPMPSLAPPMPSAPSAPSPSPNPAGTHGAFGGIGFGSSGGVRPHMHVDPYMVMKVGNIPGVAPSGRNIRSGVTNAGQRVQYSMPYQTAPLSPDVAMPPMPLPGPAAPGAAMPMTPPAPAATHGFGAFSWNPFNWFRKPGHAAMVAAQAHMRGFGMHCEMVGPRSDGTRVLICGGSVKMVVDKDGRVLMNAYANPDYY